MFTYLSINIYTRNILKKYIIYKIEKHGCKIILSVVYDI